jgi:hypothetical protein
MTDLFKLILGILASRFKAEQRWKRKTWSCGNRSMCFACERRSDRTSTIRIVFYLFGSVAGFRRRKLDSATHRACAIAQAERVYPPSRWTHARAQSSPVRILSPVSCSSRRSDFSPAAKARSAEGSLSPSDEVEMCQMQLRAGRRKRGSQIMPIRVHPPPLPIPDPALEK